MYHATMNGRALRVLMIVLLAGLVVVTALSPAHTGSGVREPGRTLVRDGFLFGLPLILAACLLVWPRWVFMASVIYATIGLAVDLSTLVLELSDPYTRPEVLRTTVLTSAINLLLILLGWYAFVSGWPAGMRSMK